MGSPRWSSARSTKIEIFTGSLLEIRTELLEIKVKTIRFLHRMINSETAQTVATMGLLVAYLDTEARKAPALPGHAIAKRGRCWRTRPRPRPKFDRLDARTVLFPLRQTPLLDIPPAVLQLCKCNLH